MHARRALSGMLSSNSQPQASLCSSRRPRHLNQSHISSPFTGPGSPEEPWPLCALMVQIWEASCPSNVSTSAAASPAVLIQVCSHQTIHCQAAAAVELSFFDSVEFPFFYFFYSSSLIHLRSTWGLSVICCHGCFPAPVLCSCPCSWKHVQSSTPFWFTARCV